VVTSPRARSCRSEFNREAFASFDHAGESRGEKGPVGVRSSTTFRKREGGTLQRKRPVKKRAHQGHTFPIRGRVAPIFENVSTVCRPENSGGPIRQGGNRA